MKELPVDEVVFREDLYPRIEKEPSKVDQYGRALDRLPPIEVNQNRELIDGWHRWTAHREAGEEKIPATVTKTRDDDHFFELAVRRNADHGLQLSEDDKKSAGRRIYRRYPPEERDADLKRKIADVLSVSTRTVQGWTSRIDKDARRENKNRARQLWKRCYSYQEIGDAIGKDKSTAQRWIEDSLQKRKLADLQQSYAATFQDYDDPDTDLKRPLYNVRWEWKEKDDGTTHAGNTDSRIVDRLLYLYTDPWDIVVDTFAGSGSTAKVCENRSRRYWLGDRKVSAKVEDFVREHDITDGLPDLRGRWGDVNLVYLDPPYWRQAQGEYSDDPTDLANMPLDEFNDTLESVISGFADKLHEGYIALIIQPTQWRAPKRQFTDHVKDMLCAVDLPVHMRIQAPYESQQANAQQVKWAKKNETLLSRSREVVVWGVS